SKTGSVSARHQPRPHWTGLVCVSRSQWNPHSESASEEMQRRARPREAGRRPNPPSASPSSSEANGQHPGPTRSGTAPQESRMRTDAHRSGYEQPRNVLGIDRRRRPGISWPCGRSIQPVGRIMTRLI
ncbi:MAG: hypothetical protein GY820_21590, partial [Gammaproteobacteria bacterium]|nr:hypothetical protein [Gammaproteobacteria bacterium]